MPALHNVTHEKYAQEFVLCGHLRKAAVAAGVSYHAAWSVRTRPDVDARIQELVEQRFAKASISAERVIKELGRIAFADPRDLYDPETGNLLPVHELDDDAAAALSRVEVEVRGEGHGEDRTFFLVKKVRMHDKVAALTLLARHFKVVGEESDGVNALANALADRLKSARVRVASAAVAAQLDAEDAVILPHPDVTGRRLEYALPEDPSDADDVSHPDLSLPVHDPEALHSGHTPPERESPHKTARTPARPTFQTQPHEAEHEDLR